MDKNNGPAVGSVHSLNKIIALEKLTNQIDFSSSISAILWLPVTQAEGSDK